MAVIAHVVVRDETPAQYDRVRAEAGWLAETPTGGLAHLTWWQDGDCHSLNAWESEAAFATFAETRLMPAMQRAGVDRVPEVTFFPAHEVFLPAARTLTATPIAAVAAA